MRQMLLLNSVVDILIGLLVCGSLACFSLSGVHWHFVKAQRDAKNTAERNKGEGGWCEEPA